MRDCAKRRPGRRGAGGPAMPDEAEILSRGLDAFAELGYAGASVRELAKRLGVSHNFVNDRYGSKAAFWQAVVADAMRRTAAQITAVIDEPGMDDACRLAAVVRRFYRIAACSPQVNRLMADESTRESERIDFLYSSYIGPTLAGLQPTIERLVAAGRVPAVPMHLLFLAITGPAISLTQDALGRCMGQPPQTEAEIISAADALASLVLDGLLKN